jgi:predicted nucleic acid-binding protein
MDAYADTSFLVSLYSRDVHSREAALAVQRQRPRFLLTPLGELEFVTAVALGVFRKVWTASEAQAVQARFREHIDAGVFSLQALPLTVWDLAGRMAGKRAPHLGTRTLDILHVASAVALKAGTFYTFDDRQRKLAEVEGLRVRN